MSTPYERVKGGKLKFKGGLGIEKAIKKTKKHKKKIAAEQAVNEEVVPAAENKESSNNNNNNIPGSTIDPTSRKNYEELFPVEAKKFGFAGDSNPKTAQDALNERVKRKADRYCK